MIVILVRLLNLDKGMSADEGWLWRRGHVPISEFLAWMLKGSSVFPPLSPFLFKIWLVFGSSEIWARLYFVFFGTSLCVLIYHIGKHCIDRWYALIVFFISSLSPLLISSSQLIRSYIDSSFWMVLSMFLLLKGFQSGFSLKLKLGYVAATVLSLWSSYLSGFIWLSQNLFYFVFNFADKEKRKQWLCMQAIIIILFLPCLFFLYHQLYFARGIHERWNVLGLHVLGFNLGQYARGLGAVLGLDPEFLSQHPLTKIFNSYQLFFASFAGIFIFVLLCFKSFKNLHERLNYKMVSYFFLLHVFFSIVIFFIFVELTHFPLVPRYFIVQHVLFIFVIAGLFYPLRQFKKVSIACGFIIMTTVYGSRIPEAVKPSFEMKKAATFLKGHMTSEDCVLMVRNTNRYIESIPERITYINQDYQLDSTHESYRNSEYLQKVDSTLKLIPVSCQRLWFHRIEGNDELLGANKTVLERLSLYGYQQTGLHQFKRVDLIVFERKKDY